MILKRKRLRDFFLLVCLVFGRPARVDSVSLRWLLAGSAILLVGATLHFISKGYLNRNASLTVSGPYRFVRHPFYVSNFVIDLGMCVIAANPWVIGAYVVCFVLLYVPTMKSEERELRALHGDAFDVYRRRVPAFIPWRFPSRAGEGQRFSKENLIRESEIPRLLQVLVLPAGLFLGLLIKADLMGHRPLVGDALPLKVALIVWVVAVEVVSIVLHRRVRILKQGGLDGGGAVPDDEAECHRREPTL